MNIKPLVANCRVGRPPAEVVPKLFKNGKPCTLTYNDCDLSGADFSGSAIYKLRLDRCDLSGAKFDNAFLPLLELQECYWTPGDPPSFKGAVLWCANLDFEPDPIGQRQFAPKARSIGNFKGADLSGAVLSFGKGVDGRPAENFSGAFLLGATMQKIADTDVFQRVDALLPAAPTAMPAAAQNGPDGVIKVSFDSKRNRLLMIRGFITHLARLAVDDDGKTLETIVGSRCKFGTPREAFGALRLNDPKVGRVALASDTLACKSGRVFWAAVLYQVSEFLHFGRANLAGWAHNNAGDIVASEVIAAMSKDVATGLSIFDETRPGRASVPQAQIFAVADLVLAQAHRRFNSKVCNGMHKPDRRWVQMQFTHLAEHFGRVGGYSDQLVLRIPPDFADPDFAGALMNTWAHKIYPAGGAKTPVPVDMSNCRVDCPRKNGARNIALAVKYVQPRIDGLRSSSGRRAYFKNWHLRSLGGPIDAAGVTFVDCSFYNCDLHLWDLDATEFINCSFKGSRFGSRRWSDVERWGSIIEPGYDGFAAKSGRAPEGFPTKGKLGILPYYATRPVLRNCDLYYAKVGSISESDFKALFHVDAACTLPEMWSPAYKATLEKRGRKKGMSPKSNDDRVPSYWDGDYKSYERAIAAEMSRVTGFTFKV